MYQALGILSEHIDLLQRQLTVQHPLRTAATIAGLLVEPKYQANCLRLETLVHLALMNGEGGSSLRARDLRSWFDVLGASPIGMMEDPAEDVFIGHVHDRCGNYRTFEGIWEKGDFSLQRFLDVLDAAPSDVNPSKIVSSVRALLLLSDAVATRRGLPRYTVGETSRRHNLDALSDERLGRLRAAVRFTPTELASLGIDRKALSSFVFDFRERERLALQEIGDTDLERRPLVLGGQDILVLLPTAISAAIRRYVIEWIVEAGLNARFEAAMARVYQNLMWTMPILGGPTKVPLLMRQVAGYRLAEASHEIDTGRRLHLVFVVEGLEGFSNRHLNGIHPNTSGISAAIIQRVEKFRADAIASTDRRSGLSLIVYCGYGRRTLIKLPQAVPNWRVEHINVGDLETLSWTPGFSPLKFWKMLDARDALAERGIEIMNPNGLLNLYAWWKASDYRYLPTSVDQEEIPNLLVIPTDGLCAIRIDVRRRSDDWRVARVNGEMVPVRRDSRTPLLIEEGIKPLYASSIDLLHGRLIGVYVGANRPWWVEFELSVGMPQDLAYQIWDALRNWTACAAPILEKRWTKLPRGPLDLHIRFTRFELPHSVEPISEVDLDALIEVRVEPTRRSVLVELAPEFLRGFATPSNVAERALVRSIVQGYAMMAAESPSNAELAAVVQQIVPNEYARHVHIMFGRGYRDFMRERLPDHPLLLEEEDDAGAKFGLAWLVRQPEDGREIHGVGACREFLLALVEEIWQRQRSRLAYLDRTTVLRHSLLNIEAIAADEEHWDRSSRALLALHAGAEGVAKATAERAFKRHGANLAARLIIEMAQCESPLVNGFPPGELDIAPLMADALLLHQLGGFADAIANGTLAPSIRIASSGDVLVEPELSRLIMEPLGRRFEGDRLLRAVARYESYFEMPSYTPTVEGVLPSELVTAFKNEFDFGIDEVRRFCDILEEEGRTRNEAIYIVRKDDLFGIVTSAHDLPEEVARAIIGRQTLQPRPSWATTPAGFKDRDWWPWRFRRRLSVLARPLLQIDTGPDSQFVVSPGLVRTSMMYLLSGCLEASFDEQFFVSRDMQRWIGSERDRRGHAFNETVRDRLHGVGLVALANVKLTQILNAKLDRNYGDVDVLAWRPGATELYIIECKDFEHARSYGEAAGYLARFKGDTDDRGRRDELRKMLDRCELIRLHCERAARFTGQVGVFLVPMLIFSRPMPMCLRAPVGLRAEDVLAIDDIEARFRA